MRAANSHLKRKLRAKLLSAAAFLTVCCFSVSPSTADQYTEICGALIVSRYLSSGYLCLFVPNSQNGTKVQIRSCPSPGSSPNLGFLWRAKRTVDGAWLITSLLSRDERRIEVERAGKDNGSAVIIWAPAAALFDKQQIWSFLPVQSGFKIVGLDSGKCLNVPLGRVPVNQQSLQIYQCEDAANNEWTLRPILNACQ
jgi:hypothetical protein